VVIFARNVAIPLFVLTLLLRIAGKKKRRKRRLAPHVTKLPIAMAVQQDYAKANAEYLSK
jgi:uncharacterized membrane protein YcaP (DUF421 family)